MAQKHETCFLKKKQKTELLDVLHVLHHILGSQILPSSETHISLLKALTGSDLVRVPGPCW